MAAERVRELRVPGVSAYVDRIGVAPGGTARFHVSTPAAYEFALVRLGRRAILETPWDDGADRADVEVLHVAQHAQAAPQTITPGSYVLTEGSPIPSGALTLAVWLRLWRLPVLDVTQWSWSGVITDFDYPERCRFAILVDHLGRVGLYLGDGGLFRQEWMHFADTAFGSSLGEWIHIAGTFDNHLARIFVGGELAHEDIGSWPTPAVSSASRLRIGANAEAGEADDFLDGDVAEPFVGQFVLSLSAAQTLFRNRGRRSPSELGLRESLAYWPLDEERGERIHDLSGHSRHGRIINHGTWQIGGPDYDPSNHLPTYDPWSDVTRGHGLRLSSDDLVDCAWPVSDSWQIPNDADSGLYAARVRPVGADDSEAVVVPFIVTRRSPRRSPCLALLSATNTWYAYGRRPTKELPIAGLSSSCYSTHVSGRPFFHVGTKLPIPRADPYGFESRRAARTRSSHLVRPERFAEAWLNAEGYPYECITDADLHEEPSLLGRFQALVLCGHSEYWTDAMRNGLRDYLNGGGQVLSLSGDTLSVRVSFNDDATVMEARKIVVHEDARWLSPRQWGERWHSDDQLPGGSFRYLGAPSWELLGLGFKGMIDDGTPTAFWAFRVMKPDHFLFHQPETVEISKEGTIGDRSANGSRASGYEFDASPNAAGLIQDPVPGVTVLATAVGQVSLEWLGLADHGGEIVYYERPQGGRVINVGSIGATGALAVDSGIQTFVRNSLSHFGIPKTVTKERMGMTRP